MTTAVEYFMNKADEAEAAEHLSHCNDDFVPPLSDRVQIADYAKKIAGAAIRFEAWSEGTLIGLVAAYCNAQNKGIAYITSVSVLKSWTGKGIAERLMNQCIDRAEAMGMRQINLEVASANTPAIRLYEKSGFVAGKANAQFLSMSLYLKGKREHE